MALKRVTRSNTALETTTTTTVTNAQLQAMIDQGVIAALAARDANRSTNGDDSHVSGTGTEVVVELIQWFEKMETVFSISNCSVENQIKFSTCTLFAGALTWWNSHVRTVGHDVAYAMTWIDLKNKMTDKYCLRVEIKKLEAELMFPEESDKIERYVGGLPDMIHGSVVASKPKTMQEAIEIATEIMDRKICTFDLVRRSHTGDLNPYALNATITMTVHVLPNATSVTELAIWLVTVGVPPIPTLLTTKGVSGQVRSLLAMNVEPKDTLRGIVQS
ncbi:hypothetical protein Tco_1397632 [Tanacetum coccineum]